MYELIQVANRTFYIDLPTKVGVYLLDNHNICLIDSGSDKEDAYKILQLLDKNKWNLQQVLITHSHADHIGGCATLVSHTGCEIYVPEANLSFTKHAELEPALLYGGYPPKALRNKYFMAQHCLTRPLSPEALPYGIEMLQLDGHSPSMVAFCTQDRVWFLGDCITSLEIIKKYHIPYLYNVANYLESIKKAKNLDGICFIPSHTSILNNIKELTDSNAAIVHQNISLIRSLCQDCSFEDILKRIFEIYGLQMDYRQYVLVSSTVKSYLSYLSDLGEVSSTFRNNKLYWISNQ